MDNYCKNRKENNLPGLSIQLGGGAIYNSTNPFDFMEMISIEGKTNFFEKRVGEYSLATKDKGDDTFSLNDDF